MRGTSGRGAYHGCGQQVGPVLRVHDTGVAVWACDLAQDASDGVVIALELGLVDVGDALVGVPGRTLLGVHLFDLEQRRALVLVRLGPWGAPGERWRRRGTGTSRPGVFPHHPWSMETQPSGVAAANAGGGSSVHW